MMETTHKSERKLIAEHRLDIGTFYFYPNIVVGQFEEGVHVTIENATLAIQLAQEIFGKKTRFIYISHRRRRQKSSVPISELNRICHRIAK